MVSPSFVVGFRLGPPQYQTILGDGHLGESPPPTEQYQLPYGDGTSPDCLWWWSSRRCVRHLAPRNLGQHDQLPVASAEGIAAALDAVIDQIVYLVLHGPVELAEPSFKVDGVSRLFFWLPLP